MANLDIGIDLGSANILIYVKGRGVVLSEPSVIAYDKDSERIVEIGDEAKAMLGRTPGNLTAIRPLKHGVKSEATKTEKMLKYFIRKAVGKNFFGRRKYTSSEVELFHVHPYAVKEYERRWYLVGYCVEREGLRLYGMDRILDLLYSGKSFVMPKDLDIREKFVFSFGPYLPEGKPQIIRLKAFGTEALFLKDLPLHESQTLVSEDEEGAVFRLYLIPTRNFVMELCRHGARIEVLEPLSLRDEVAAEHERALSLYRGPDLVLE